MLYFWPMLRPDTYRHQGLRKKLIELLREKGITDEKVLSAMQQVPRHLFLDDAFLAFAYDDTAFKIGEGQTISQPYTVAYQTMLLEVKPHHTILEIGTGSGYQAAVLANLADKVFTIERHKILMEKARNLLKSLGYNNIRCFFGDGFQGVPAFAPYDGIIITAAAPEIPEALVAQMKIGAHLVVPLGEGEVQTMQRITRTGEDTYHTESFDHFKFVPMLKGKVS